MYSEGTHFESRKAGRLCDSEIDNKAFAFADCQTFARRESTIKAPIAPAFSVIASWHLKIGLRCSATQNKLLERARDVSATQIERRETSPWPDFDDVDSRRSLLGRSAFRLETFEMWTA